MPLSPPSEIFGLDGIVVLVVVLLALFGSTQIPRLARSLGSAQKEFKKGSFEDVSQRDADRHPLQAVPPGERSPTPAAATVETPGSQPVVTS